MILAIQSVRLDASNGESVNLGEMGAESDAGPLTLLAALSGNHVIPIRRR